MLFINIVLTVRDEKEIDTVGRLLAEHGRLSREEPGCARFEAYHSQSDPKVFVLSEWWESEADLDRHREAQAYQTIYKPQVLPLVDRVPHVSTLLE